MIRIADRVIEDIRSRVDIVELVSEYVPAMSRSGRNMKGRCPFHQERTPSFIVSPERQTFHCFGCGEGGDAFGFLMKVENIAFPEAAEKLAARAGIVLTKDSDLSPADKERLRLKEILEFAAAHYNECLLKDPAGDSARQYFKSRKVTSESAKRFSLGFAAGKGAMLAAAQKRGFAAADLVKAGLAAVRDGKPREYFFGRVMFPIKDAKGAVIAFGGRVLGEGEPKYLNSPETPLFSKRNVLYGLFEGLSEIRKARRAVLMEGYMDVIAAHQHGINLACAPLGTALTPEHAALLKRYVSEVVVVFDADSAGVNAAVRGTELLLKEGLSVRIATVPSGKDPDEHLHEKGRESFEKCLEKAVDLVEFKTELLLSRHQSPLSPEAKSSVAREVLASINLSPDEILKAEWMRRLSQRLDLSEQSLRRQSGLPVESPSARTRHSHSQPAKAPASGPMSPADGEILILLFQRPALSAEISDADFESERGRKIWKALSGMEPWAAGWESRLLGVLAPAEKTAASELFILVSGMKGHDPETVLRRALSRRRASTRLSELSAMLRGGTLEETSLREEFHRLLVELKGSNSRNQG